MEEDHSKLFTNCHVSRDTLYQRNCELRLWFLHLIFEFSNLRSTFIQKYAFMMTIIHIKNSNSWNIGLNEYDTLYNYKMFLLLRVQTLVLWFYECLTWNSICETFKLSICWFQIHEGWLVLSNFKTVS